ncbi:glycoside hydrolase, family 57 [Methanoculleus marisnigri JR1]|uniref:Glycoside hydrolase, family 57 n=1 Tax=Methanoculleus marisnigri (strain ATCC 35101 / DSM 1498 / JR1) TaxID=368407 RepID=A3CUZ4_METMJ|nr:DUF3536 domain-containing protein [Methanoculleus marisnigri]ABN57194.1 glycoside hydrolase, family 57 [Methanoculleus marisnigri JR1]
MRAVCIHGHFYQPPRENPWLGEVGVQRSAAPYHDWNERVTAECYAPNTAARILDDDGMIEELVNNYARISFTAAPTLFAWLERHRPDIYGAILDADRESRERYGGHGSAIACCYNHVIMPLAARRDKRAQVAWGVRDFASRFGREPEGMWLPETAVDIESLEALAAAGIRFTILAPHQAAGVRAIGEDGWMDVSGGGVETRMPYLCRLPSGRSIAVFFYDGTIARDVAFGDLLSDGRRLADRLTGAFSRERGRPELVHIATDAETYGHHREFGEMALARCLRAIEAHRDIRLTVYGEYLAAHPPTHEALVREETSWSCAHGIERWRGECGCHTGKELGWSQAWRGPLREAIEMVRDALAPRSEEALALLVRDPAEARDNAVDLVLARWSDESVAAFFSRHAPGGIDAEGRRRALSLLEAERQAMLMQTSCGWFFDDITEPGGVQVMRHAKRAMDIARQAFGLDLEARFVEILRRAPVNDPRYATGAEVYDVLVRPAAADLPRIAAGTALYALFGLDHPAAASGIYDVAGDWPYRLNAKERRILGTVRVRCRATGEEALFDAAVCFSGIDRVVIGVREDGGGEAFWTVWESSDPAGAIAGAFSRVYTAPDLSDEERWTIAREIAPGIGDAVCAVYRDAMPTIGALDDLGIPAPGAAVRLLAHARAERLLAMIGEGCPDPGLFYALAEEMRAGSIEPDLAALGEAASRRITFALRAAAARPDDPAPLEEVSRIVGCAKIFPLLLALWESQNICVGMRGHYAEVRERAGRGDGGAERWTEAFGRAAACLGVRVT